MRLNSPHQNSAMFINFHTVIQSNWPLKVHLKRKAVTVFKCSLRCPHSSTAVWTQHTYTTKLFHCSQCKCIKCNKRGTLKRTSPIKSVPVIELHRLKPPSKNISRLLNKWKPFNAQPMNKHGENISKLSLVWIFFNHSMCSHCLFLNSQIPPQGSTNLKI